MATIDEAVVLCRAAAQHGTGRLFVTPHVNRELPLTAERDSSVRTNARLIGDVVSADGLEIRVGYEVDPELDPGVDEMPRYRLVGYDAVLVECPLTRSDSVAGEQIVRVAETVTAAGLLPVLAHPERSSAILADPALARTAAERGWLLQVTGASLSGRYGEAVTGLAWQMIEEGIAHLVASDGHRPDRPPVLDEVSVLLSERVGSSRARDLLTAAALRSAAVETR